MISHSWFCHSYDYCQIPVLELEIGESVPGAGRMAVIAGVFVQSPSRAMTWKQRRSPVLFGQKTHLSGSNNRSHNVGNQNRLAA